MTIQTKNKNHATKERILTAAKQEFAQFGFDGARMGSIAKRADANQALLHYYFDSKEKLYDEIIQHYFAVDDEKLIRDAVSMWSLTREQELYMGIYLLVRFPLGALGQELSKILTREVAEGREHLEKILAQYILPKLISFQEVIKSGIEEGIFETKNSFLVVMQLLIFVISYGNLKSISLKDETQRHLFNLLFGDISDEDIFDFLLEHTFKGLTPVGKVVKIPDFPKNNLESLDKLIFDIGKLRAETLSKDL
jgi:AcrR family transcriptional regulator